MTCGSATKIDRYWVLRSVWLGLLLIAAGYFALQATWFPIAPHSVELHAQRIAMAIGAAVVAVAIVLTVIAAMGIISSTVA